MASKSGALSVDRAWNTVALEERIDLVSKSQAQGLTAGVIFCLFVGCVAYGFDEIRLLTVAVGGVLIITPLFSSQRWRREKPELILRYLAARSVARRYAYGCNIPDLEISILYRGYLKEVFNSEEDEIETKMGRNVDVESSGERSTKEVWICLMEGGIVVLSERPGGAKLEFSAAFTPEFDCDYPNPEEAPGRYAITLRGTGISRSKLVTIWSSSVGAQYVFERRLRAIVDEGFKERQRAIEQIATKGR